MAVLWVDEGFKKELSRKVDSYNNELLDVKKMYDNALNQAGAYMGDYNVSSCNTFLQKRKKALDDAISSAKNLKYEADKYVARVVSTDQKVADSIHVSSYSFYKRKHIGPQSDSIWGRSWNSICTTVDDFLHEAGEVTSRVVQDIMDFYDKYKYVVDVVRDVLAVTAAVALFAMSGGTILGIICAVGAAWASAKAFYELETDIIAVVAWRNGDEGKAAKLNSMTFSGLFVDAGELLDEKLHTNVFEGAIKLALVGLEGCEFVCEIMEVWESFREIFNLKVRSDGKPLNSLDFRVEMKPQSRKAGINWLKLKMTKGNGLRLKGFNNNFKCVAWILGFSVRKDARNTFETVTSFVDNKLENYERFKKITSDPSSLLDSMPLVSQSMDFWKASSEIFAM